jgi:hypothetical protein
MDVPIRHTFEIAFLGKRLRRSRTKWTELGAACRKCRENQLFLLAARARSLLAKKIGKWTKRMQNAEKVSDIKVIGPDWRSGQK